MAADVAHFKKDFKAFATEVAGVPATIIVDVPEILTNIQIDRLMIAYHMRVNKQRGGREHGRGYDGRGNVTRRTS